MICGAKERSIHLMSTAYVILLAIIQGLTEFLPISSSGHLALTPKLLEAADQGLVMDVALHVGTLLAVLVYYRADVLAMVMAVVRWNDPARADARRLGIFIAIASVPAVIAGFILHVIDLDLRHISIIIVTTLFFGVVMGAADHFMPRTRKLQDLRLRHAFLIGCAQTFALIPGTSRSGVTMTMARLLSFDRVDAARFSFLLGIPAILGAGTLGFLELLEKRDGELWFDAGVGMAVAFIAGLGAIHFMIRWLSRYGLMPFAVYRVVLGCGLIFYTLYQV